MAVHVPRGLLAVVGGLDGDTGAGAVTGGEQPRGGLGLHGGLVHLGGAPLVEGQRREGRAELLGDVRAEGRHDEVALDGERLVLVAVVRLRGVVVLHLVHLHADDLLVVVEQHALRGAVREELAALEAAHLHLLVDAAHVRERAAERDNHAGGAAAESGAGAVEGGVAAAEHEHLAVQGRQRGLDVGRAGAAAGGRQLLRGLARGGQQVLRGVVPVGGAEVVEDGVALGGGETNRHDAGTAVGHGGQRRERGELFAADRAACVHADAEVLHELDLELHGVGGEAVLRDLRRAQAAGVGLGLVHVDVAVAEAGEVCRGGHTGGAGANDGDGRVVRGDILRGGDDGGVERGGDLHLAERVHCEGLEPADVDGALLRARQVAAADAQVLGGADHAAREADGVVTQNELRRAVVVGRRDALDELLDVDRRRARALARGVGALEAATGFEERALGAEDGRVLHVLPVVLAVVAGLVGVALPLLLLLARLCRGAHFSAAKNVGVEAEVLDVVEEVRGGLRGGRGHLFFLWWLWLRLWLWCGSLYLNKKSFNKVQKL
eukprot:PhM_4_TR3356/c0_g1_i1/m.29093